MMSSVDERSVRTLCDGFAGFVPKLFRLDALLSLVGKAMLR